MLGRHLYVRPLIFETPYLPPSLCCLSVDGIARCLFEWGQCQKLLWPSYEPWSPTTSASQASEDEIIFTFHLFPSLSADHARTINYFQPFLTHIEGLFQNEYLLWYPSVTFRKKSDIFASSYYKISLSLWFYFRSLTTGPPHCAFFPWDPQCCLFPALQLHSCHSGCWPALLPLVSFLSFSPDPSANSSFGFILKGTWLWLELADPCCTLSWYPLVSYDSLEVVFSSRTQALCGEDRCSCCLLLPPGACPWERLPSGSYSWSELGLADCPW